MKAKIRKLIATVRKLPYASTGTPALRSSTRVSVVPGGILASGRYQLLKSSRPNTILTTGMIRSVTTESTILPNAPPMITPTAKSITLPLTANSLNSLTIPISTTS